MSDSWFDGYLFRLVAEKEIYFAAYARFAQTKGYLASTMGSNVRSRGITKHHIKRNEKQDEALKLRPVFVFCLI